MYIRDAKLIAEYAAQSPENVNDVVRFVSLTIRMQFKTIGKQYRDVKANGLNSRFVWGNKKKTFQFLIDNPETVGAIVRKDTDVALAELVQTVPGLGNIKAGFVLQLCGHETGCLDTWNLRKYGLNAEKVKLMKAPEYNQLCKNLGGSAFLWDNWCEILAEQYGENADTWSRLHSATILENA